MKGFFSFHFSWWLLYWFTDPRLKATNESQWVPLCNICRKLVQLNCSNRLCFSLIFKFIGVKMDFSQQLQDLWIYLNEENETLHMPLIYIVMPVCVLTVIMWFVCCFFCLRACFQPSEVHFVPSFLPTMPVLRRRNTADIIRMPEGASTSAIEVDTCFVERFGEHATKW